MSWSGAMTGTRKIVRQAMLLTLKARHQPRTVSFAAAPGAVTRGTYGPRLATGTILATGATA